MDEMWFVAQRWLWKRREKAPAGADIWDLRFHWPREMYSLWEQVNTCSYTLSPMRVYRRANGESLAQWSARDALVLKWAALHAGECLPVHPRCEHGKGRGGVVRSVEKLHAALLSGQYKFVLRTDIKGYYRQIRKQQLWAQVSRYISDRRVTTLIKQYLYYSVDNGGDIHTPLTGIPRGCALSPLLGACLLYHMDADFNIIEDCYYARYMDDFIILAPTRWRLRRCVAGLNHSFEWGGFQQHPNKTYIGKISNGVDWLGVGFNEHGATGVAERALKHHRERCLRLYEQACRLRLSHDEAVSRVQTYRKRWLTWATRLLP